MARAVSSPTLLRTAGKTGASGRREDQAHHGAKGSATAAASPTTESGRGLGGRSTVCRGLALCVWRRASLAALLLASVAAGRRTPRRCRRASARRRCGAAWHPDRGALRARTAGCSWPPRPGSSTRSTASSDPTPTRLRRPPPEGPRLLGPRDARAGARPRFDRAAVRLRRLRVRQGARASTSPLGRRVPDRRRARPTAADRRPAVAPGATGRDRPDRGLLPAVPQPLGRVARVRPRRDALRELRRRRLLRLRRPRADRQPVRRPAGRAAGRSRRRRRRAARCAPVVPRPAGQPRPRTARSCAWTRTPAPPAGQPAIARADPTPGIVAYGFRNPFRFTFRPGTSESGRRRRLEHVGGDQPHAGPLPRPQLRLAVLRGRARRRGATTR